VRVLQALGRAHEGGGIPGDGARRERHQAVKRDHGVPTSVASCHTGRVGDYVIEGHVPADLVQKMLAEKATFAGLAVPGMPMGSPGMEGPRKDAYDVLAFDKGGKTTVYARR